MIQEAIKSDCEATDGIGSDEYDSLIANLAVMCELKETEPMLPCGRKFNY
jgi:hypothetical protein